MPEQELEEPQFPELEGDVDPVPPLPLFKGVGLVSIGAVAGKVIEGISSPE